VSRLRAVCGQVEPLKYADCTAAHGPSAPAKVIAFAAHCGSICTSVCVVRLLLLLLLLPPRLVLGTQAPSGSALAVAAACGRIFSAAPPLLFRTQDMRTRRAAVCCNKHVLCMFGTTALMVLSPAANKMFFSFKF
jgi:hypothetical protein